MRLPSASCRRQVLWKCSRAVVHGPSTLGGVARYRWFCSHPGVDPGSSAVFSLVQTLPSIFWGVPRWYRDVDIGWWSLRRQWIYDLSWLLWIFHVNNSLWWIVYIDTTMQWTQTRVCVKRCTTGSISWITGPESLQIIYAGQKHHQSFSQQSFTSLKKHTCLHLNNNREFLSSVKSERK